MSRSGTRRGFIKGAAASIAIALLALRNPEETVAASPKSVVPMLTKVPMFQQFPEPATSAQKVLRRENYLRLVVAAAKKVSSPSGIYLVKYKEHDFSEILWVPISMIFSSDGEVWWADISQTAHFLWFDHVDWVSVGPVQKGWCMRRFRDGENFFPELFDPAP
jgi:hypothetical protein